MLFDARFRRFLIVGAINTIFGYGVFYLMLLATHGPSLSVAIAAVAGALFNFLSIGRVVFLSTDKRLLWRFAVVYAAIYIVDILALRLLQACDWPAAFGQALLLPLIALLSFFLNRAFVFERARSEQK